MESVNKQLTFSIAGFICELIIEDRNLREYFKERYLIESRVKNPSIKILISKDKTKYIIISFPLKLKAELPLTTIKEGINSIIAAFIEFNLIDKGIILLHASGFIKERSAFLFSGESGSGKTTVLSNVPVKKRICDDVAVIRKVKSQYLTYYSSFDFGRIGRKNATKSLILKEIFILNKAKRIKIEQTRFAKCFSAVLNGDYLGMAGLLNQRSKKEGEITIGNFKKYRKLISKHNRLLMDFATLVEFRKLSFPKKFNWRDIK